jgi:hypothetical protein
MNNVDRAKQEFERIMRETEQRERRGQHLERLEQFDELFAEAKRLGLDEKTAWRIVEREPSDLKIGVLALIEEVGKRQRGSQA